MSTAAQRRKVANAYTEAGLLVGPILLRNVVDAVTTLDREEAIADLTRRLDGLDRRLATKLVDLARESLNL